MENERDEPQSSYEKLRLRVKTALFSIFLFIFSLALLFCSEYFSRSLPKAWDTLTHDIAVALVSVAVVNVGFDLFLRSEMLDVIFKYVRLEREIIDSGIERVSSHRSNVDLHALIRSAKSSILIHSLTARGPLINVIEDLKRAAERGVDVKILISAPNNPALEQRATARHRDDDAASERLSDEVRAAEAMIKGIREYLGAKGPAKANNITIREYQAPAYCSIYKFDEKLVYSPYLYGIRGPASPVWIFSEASIGSSIVLKLNEHVERLWQDSVAV